MPTAFVTITPDPFAALVGEVPGAPGSLGTDIMRPVVNYNHVRRPVRGIQIKADTYATIRVVRADGSMLPLFDAGGQIPENQVGPATSVAYSNFLVQSITESRTEKQQIVETFGEPYIFFYGEQPRMLSVSGTLLNTADFNWRAEWWQNYNLYLRGTKCVENRSRVWLVWDDILVEGYLLKAEAAEQAQQPNAIQFSFILFLTNYQNFSDIGNYHFPKVVPEASSDPAEARSYTPSPPNDLWLNRQRNLQLDQMADVNKNSLLSALRKGLSTLVDAEGMIHRYSDLATNFLAGRSVRVPRGYEGTAAYNDLQIAVGSVDIKSAIAAGTAGTAVDLFKVRFGNQDFTVRYTVPPEVKNNNWLGYIQENQDEYIARRTSISSYAPNNRTLVDFKQQQLDDESAAQQVRDVYKKFGIEDLSPANDVITSLKIATFLARSVLSYQTVLDQASTYGDSLNVQGTIESAIGGSL